jgi:hypothetical protein
MIVHKCFSKSIYGFQILFLILHIIIFHHEKCLNTRDPDQIPIPPGPDLSRNFQSRSRFRTLLVSTLKRIGEVDFLIKILATMSQLCTERSLKSEKWLNFWDFTGELLLSGDLSVHC